MFITHTGRLRKRYEERAEDEEIGKIRSLQTTRQSMHRGMSIKKVHYGACLIVHSDINAVAMHC